MSKDVLVDTCSFIDYFRGADEDVIAHLASVDAIVLSKVVRLELLKGAAKSDRKALIELFEGFHALSDFPSADLTEQIMLRLHGRGFNLGFADLLILADAARSGTCLLTSDRPLREAAHMLKLPIFKMENKR